MDKPSSRVGILIFVIVLVLVGGGFAGWKVLGTKKDEEPQQEQRNAGEQLPPITGRNDVSSAATNVMTKDLIDQILGTEAKKNPKGAPPTAVLQTSDEGKQLIVERMKNIQMNEGASDTVRAVHHVGRTLVDTSSWTTKAIEAIGNMFGQLHNVDKDNYLTYPIFGKYETKGAPLRAELQGFLDQSWDGYNVTNQRHSGDAHWIGQLSLNLMYGSQNSYVHSEDEIWWMNQGQSVREGLDFFKAVNGHDKEDRELLKKVRGRPVYSAGVMHAFVQSWLNEMYYFDAVTRQTAIAALIAEGYLVKTETAKSNKMGANKK